MEESGEKNQEGSVEKYWGKGAAGAGVESQRGRWQTLFPVNYDAAEGLKLQAGPPG